MGSPGPKPSITLEDALEVFAARDQRCTPLTATDVADELGCSRRTAHRKLETLADRGDLDTKKVGAHSRVWWRPIDIDESGTTPRRFELARFDDFVGAIEADAVFALDPDGQIVSWNGGAERITGYGTDEILGEHLSVVYADEDVERDVPNQDLDGAAERGSIEDEGWWVRKDGSVFWTEITIASIRDDDGTLEGFTTIARDLTERREHERRDDASSERPFQFVGLLEADGTLVGANEAALSFAEVDREDVLGKYFWETYWWGTSEESQERLQGAIERAAAGEFVRYEADVQGADRAVTIDFSLTPITDEHGEVDHLIHEGRGVTERNRREAELRRERELTEQLLKTAPVAISVQDADGETVLANQRAQDLLGLSEPEIIGSPDDIDEWVISDADGVALGPEETPRARVRATGEPVFNEEIAIDPPDRTRLWVSVNAVPMFDPDGALERVVTSGEDITELKERERQLERRRNELETELNEILGRVSDAFYALDDEWRFEHVNEQGEEIIQRTEAEVLGERLWDEFPEAAEGIVWEKYHEAMDTQEPVSFELYYDPLAVWVEINAYPSETGLSVYFRDISERVERERALEESERQYRTLAEHFPNGAVTLYDEDFRYQLAAGRAFDDLDVGVDDMEGRTLSEVFPDDVSRQLEPAYRAALDGEDGAVEIEFSGRQWAVYTAPVRDEDGEVFAGMTMAQDVTERIERERQLERYETIVETVGDGIYALDDELRFTMVNEAYTEMVGYPREELLGSPVSAVVDDDAVDLATQLRERLLAGEIEGGTAEVDVPTASGETVPTETAFAPLWFEDGAFHGTVGVVRDITERKARERALEQYKTAVETASDAVVTIDDGSTIQFVNPAVETVFGYEPEELVGEPLTTLMPERMETDHVESLVRYLRTGEKHLDWEYVELPGRHKAGHEVPLAVSFGEHEHDGGRFFTGIIRDNTGRMERERELARYQTVFDTVDDGICILGPDFHFVEVNDAYAAMTDYAREELVGSHCSLVMGEDVSAMGAELSRGTAAVERGLVALEADIVTEDGDRIPAESKFTALPPVDGEFQGSVGVVRDLTERENYERELRRYEKLIEESTDVNAIIDPDGTVQYVTPSVEYVLGYTSEDLHGENAFEYIHPDDREETLSDLAALVEGAEEPPISEFRFRHADGSWVWLESRARNLRDDPMIAGVVVYTRDVTDRKRYEERLSDTVGKLEESNERLEQFAYVASHDLQEPLRMISSYLQLLEDRYRDGLDEDARDFIALAVDGADRMRRMINDLLAYSRVDTQAKPLEPTDCEAALEQVLADLRLQVEETDAETDVGTLPTVDADRNQLEQLFQNLLSNAIKYRGDEVPRIEIDAEKREETWLFSVDDNGIGIDPAHTDQIFEVFNRLHTDDEYPGTGVGLALCQRIVDRHGGRIWVDSEPGHGSTFYFTIPIREGSRDETSTG